MLKSKDDCNKSCRAIPILGALVKQGHIILRRLFEIGSPEPYQNLLHEGRHHVLQWKSGHHWKWKDHSDSNMTLITLGQDGK